MQVEFKMKYVNHWTDELGRKRYRFRRKGFPGAELPVNNDPASPEFQAAYHAALRGERQEHALAMVAARRLRHRQGRDRALSGLHYVPR
jgi:hypothetical protein